MKDIFIRLTGQHLRMGSCQMKISPSEFLMNHLTTFTDMGATETLKFNQKTCYHPVAR